MKCETYRFDEVTINFDKKRIPLSARQRECRKGPYRYFGAQGVIDYIDDYIFDGEFLLIAEDGENLKSNKQNIAQIVNGKFWLNNHAHIIQSNQNCNLHYLCYLLNNMDLSGYITGSAQPKLSQTNLNSIVLRLPDVTIQKKIAKILSALDDKIECNNQINKNLEEQAHALFDNMFPDVFSGNKMVGDYIVPQRGKSLLSKDAKLGNVPVVAGGLEPSTYHNVANTIAPVITISASGANAGYVNLWHVPVWSSDSSFIDGKMTESVYFWYILLKKKQQEIFDSQTGSAQPHIYPQHIAVLRIKELNQQEIKNFNENVAALFALIACNQAENIRLQQMRDSLLPKLMSGELDVSDIDI